MNTRKMLIGILLGVIATVGLGVITAPDADAYCVNGSVPWKGDCSQFKHKDGGTSFFKVECLHGQASYTAEHVLRGGQTSEFTHACEWVSWVYVYPGTQLWCRIMAAGHSDDPYLYYWSVGWHYWNSSADRNCKVVLVARGVAGVRQASRQPV